MRRLISLVSILLAINSPFLAQGKEPKAISGNALDSLKKWEMSMLLNTPEPLTISGYDYNALTQRIFINGDRKEYAVDAGIGCARKIQASTWLFLNFNYAYYHAYEKRDSRVFYPTTNDYELDTLEIHQRSYEFTPGIFRRITFNKFQFDFGSQFRLKIFSQITSRTLYSLYDLNGFLSTVIYEESEPGGVSLGLSPLFRINYKLQNNLSVGVKLSSYISYYKTGGNITTYKSFFHVSGTSYTRSESRSNQTFEGVRFFPACMSLQISYSIF